jgi:hypothetical protein
MNKGLYSLLVLAVLARGLSAQTPPAEEETETGVPAPTPTPASPDLPEVKALAILVQAATSIEESVLTGELGQVHNEDMFLYAALGELLKQAREANKQHILSALQAVGRAVADVHEAADHFDRVQAKEKLEPMRRAFSMVFDFHGAGLLGTARLLADRFTCPMHPGVVGKRTDTCPKCAMALDVPSRIRLQPSSSATIPRMVFATVRTGQPLEVGRETPGVLVLRTRIEQPIQIFELREVHTKKIHLLLVDESLTDYHHEHPVPSATPGEYTFTFTPRKPGPYRVWADVQPLMTGIQEYAMTDIPSAGSLGEALEKTFPKRGALEGLTYELSLETATVKAGEPAGARVRVAAADGKPFTALEPLMGAFAHLVGFHEDRKTVLHMHPIESRLLKAEDRGGPDLAFRIYTETPGYYRLFLQVQIGGVSKFIPFGVEVTP